MTETPALNQQEILLAYGGDQTMFFEFLRAYDEETLNTQTLRLHKGIMKRNFEEIRLGGYFLSCGSAYLCANKLRELAKELQRRGENHESMDLILKDYMEFLNEARKVKKEIAQILKRPISFDIADFDILSNRSKKLIQRIFQLQRSVLSVKDAIYFEESIGEIYMISQKRMRN